MIPEIAHIYNILASFLGEAKNGFDGKCMQLQFPCPNCIATKGTKERHKYNLEVNIQKNVFQCWSCQSSDEHMYGTVIKLIRKYGNEQLVKDYIDTVTSLRNSEIYKIKFTNDDFKLNDEAVIKKSIDFPNDYIPLIKGNYIPHDVAKYLNERNVGWDIINKFNIGYTRWCKTDKQHQWSFRIILPSYDRYGELNYCVGRDYTGKAKNKYYNAKANKKEIIFNEEKIQWDADITLVEGPFDHIVVPNSIPLLGKVLKNDYSVYQALVENANAHINIFLDGDAYDNVLPIYRLLDCGRLKGRIRYIPTKEKNDPSLLYQIGGNKAVIEHLRASQTIQF